MKTGKVLLLFLFLLGGCRSTQSYRPVMKPGGQGTGESCTVGVVSGEITTDGRPILWKVRDTSVRCQELVFVEGEPYDYIGVQNRGEPPIYMGLNEVGVATGNTNVGTGDTSNPDIQAYILKHYGSMDEILTFIDEGQGDDRDDASGCFPFIDAAGEAWVFEINRRVWWEPFESVHEYRVRQHVWGFIVRANEFHGPDAIEHSDVINMPGRYQTGKFNIAALNDDNNLSIETIIQGDSGPRIGHEILRYGPGETYDMIARHITVSAIVVHGVHPWEDPGLSTMWVILGQTNYGIAVPTWVMVSDIPACLASGDMYDRSRELYREGNETTTQTSIFPMEAHILNMVNTRILPWWRTLDDLALIEQDAHRIEHKIAENAYSLMNCLANGQNDNQAPTVDIAMHLQQDPHIFTVSFSVDWNDPDGTIRKKVISFGDGNGSLIGDMPYPPMITHTYTDEGMYLVSLSVQDDDGVWNTAWVYHRVQVNADIEIDGIVNLGDFSVVARHWSSPSNELDGWSEGADLNRDNIVDLLDLRLLVEHWLEEK